MPKKGNRPVMKVIPLNDDRKSENCSNFVIKKLLCCTRKEKITVCGIKKDRTNNIKNNGNINTLNKGIINTFNIRLKIGISKK